MHTSRRPCLRPRSRKCQAGFCSNRFAWTNRTTIAEAVRTRRPGPVFEQSRSPLPGAAPARLDLRIGESRTLLVTSAAKESETVHALERLRSVVFSIQEIAHRIAARCVRAFVRFPSIGRPLRIGGIFFTARGTPVGKTGLSRPQLELLTANHTLFDGIGHESII